MNFITSVKKSCTPDVIDKVIASTCRPIAYSYEWGIGFQDKDKNVHTGLMFEGPFEDGKIVQRIRYGNWKEDHRPL